MAQVPILTDTHAGARNDSELVASYQKAFYDNVFFPEMDRRGLKYMLHGGDYFERRKFINFKTLSKNRVDFLDPLKERGIEMDMILGNHDVAYKNTNDLNSPGLLMESYDNVTVLEEPIKREIDGRTLALIPWINAENYEQTMDFVRDLPGDAAILGHFEFQGFEMHAGVVNEHGMGTKEFRRFPLVMSGHFHTRSQQGNIIYLGSPFEITWADYNDPRGFHVLDTDTLDLEFIKNPHVMFHKVIYNDDNGVPDLPDKDKIRDSIVQLVVEKRNNPYDLDKYLDNLYLMGPYDLQTVELVGDGLTDLSEEEIKERIKDTPQLIREYVNNAEAKDRVKSGTLSLMQELYAEANKDR